MNEKNFDVLIIGGGVLGATIAYWVSQQFDGTVAVIERDTDLGLHESRRNTGVIHRPFYLNPDKKKIWAFSAQYSLKLWKSISSEYGSPWRPTGTVEIAKKWDDLRIIDNYKKWALKNGMLEEEVTVLDQRELSELEPLVKGYGAIYSKTDASVDFRDFTLKIFEKASKNSVKLIDSTTAKKLDATGNVYVSGKTSGYLKGKVTINCAAGGALKLARSEGLGRNYTNLFFRGDYWRVGESFAGKISTNIYTVPEHHEFPFLDPHFIVRHNGVREIGPTATLVSNPYAYGDKYSTFIKMWKTLLSRPIMPKLNLFMSKEFRTLAKEEWKSSISRKYTVERVKKFIPSFEPDVLTKRGISGIRVQVIDKNGFVPEAVILSGNRSVHILNFNSPGATGAPAFSALLVYKMIEKGYFDGIPRKSESLSSNIWNINDVIDAAPEGLINDIMK